MYLPNKIIGILDVILKRQKLNDYMIEYNISKKTAIKQKNRVIDALLKVELQHPSGRKPNGYIDDMTIANKKIKELESELKISDKKLVEANLKIKGFELAISILKKMISKLNESFKLLFTNQYLRFTADEKLPVVNLMREFMENKVAPKILSSIIEKPLSTLYTWLNLYKANGIDGLIDKDSTPHSSPNKTPAFLVGIIKSINASHPHLSADGIYLYLQNSIFVGKLVRVSKSLIYKILKGETIDNVNVSNNDKKTNKKSFYSFLTDKLVYCLDFVKIEGLRVLMVIEEHSRFLLGFKILKPADGTSAVTEYLVGLFKKYKIPLIVKSDNGPEFKIIFEQFLNRLNIFHLKNPLYYAPFNGKMEYLFKRLRRYLKFIKGCIGEFNLHKILNKYQFQYNYLYGQYVLNKLTPAKIFHNRNIKLNDDNRELINIKQNSERELELKFTNRKGNNAKMFLKLNFDTL